MEKTAKFYRLGDLVIMALCIDSDLENIGSKYYEYYVRNYHCRWDCFQFAFGETYELSEEEINEKRTYFASIWQEPD